MVVMMCVKLQLRSWWWWWCLLCIYGWMRDSLVIFLFTSSIYLFRIKKVQKRHANTCHGGLASPSFFFPICGLVLQCNLKWLATKNIG